jgi:hypothetical protein
MIFGEKELTMGSSLHTDNISVAILWLAWQMTLEQIKDRTFDSPEERDEALRILFQLNHAAVLQTMS